MESRCRRVPLRPLACCFLSFALLTLTLEAQSIWWDEGISLRLAGLPWGEIVSNRAANIHPPLYFFILKVWTSLAGLTPFAGRYLSVLGVSLLPAAVYGFLARRVTAIAGRVAAFLVAFAPPFVVYGQEIRAYALLPVGVIALWSLVWPARACGPIRDGDGARRRRPRTTRLQREEGPKACRKPLGPRAEGDFRSSASGSLSHSVRGVWERVRVRALPGYFRIREARPSVPSQRQAAVRRGLLLGVVQAGLIGLHYSGAIAAGIAALGYGLRWLRGLRRGTARDIAREWLAGLAVMLVCLAPWVAVMAGVGLAGLGSQAGLSNALSEPAPVVYVAELLGIFHTTGLPGALGSPELVRSSAVVGCLLLLGGLVVSLRAGRRPSLVGLSLLWLAPFCAAPAIWAMSSQSHPRYLYAFVVGGWIIGAAVVTHHRLPRAIKTVLFAALLVSSILGLRAYFGDPAYARDDVRAAAAYIRDHAVPGDVALVPATDWSLPQYDLGDAVLVMVPPDTSLVAEGELGDGDAPRAVFALDYRHDILDPRDAVRAALAWGGAAVYRERFDGVFVERWDMYGPAGLAPCDPLPAVCVLGHDLCLVGVAYQRRPVSGSALPVGLCWTRSGPRAQDASVRFSVGLRLYGPAGNVMAAHDDVLLDGALRPTDMWAAENVISYHLLPVPVGAVPVPHTVEAALFDTQEPGRPVTLIGAGGTAQSAIVLAQVTPAVTPWRDESLYATWSLPDGPVVALSDELRLNGARIEGAEVAPGEPLHVSIAWEVVGEVKNLQPPRLLLRQAGQVIAVAPSTVAFDEMPKGRPLLETLAVAVPSEAEAGMAEIVLVSGAKSVILSDVDVLGDVHTYEPPPFDTVIGVRASHVATLLGGDLEPGTSLTPGLPLTLTLIWRAEFAAADQDLKVFTHLVAASGEILAQHDGQPADWTRPTTGWLTGEVIVDTHVLTWSPSADEFVARGDAVTLLLGLYDGRTGARIVWQDGQDFLLFPLAVTVTPAAAGQE
jgi:hypothetical protein